jgi:hypothetical protein
MSIQQSGSTIKDPGNDEYPLYLRKGRILFVSIISTLQATHEQHKEYL